MSDKSEIEKLADFVEEWRVDAALFVRDQFGIEPTAQQALALSAASARGARVAVKSGHGTGKSTVLAWLIIWMLCCFDDVKVPLTAPSFQQLKDIVMPEVEKWRQKMLEPWKSAISVKNNKVEINGINSFCSARAGNKSNPEALQGFHAVNLLFLIDEASGVFQGVFDIAQGSLSTSGARIIMMSNPTRTSGYFFKAFHGDRESWQRLTFNCLDSPIVDPEYIKNMRELYGVDSDIYRVRVLGEFPGGSDLQFIGVDIAEEALNRRYDPSVYNQAPRVLGVDVAAYGGDRSVIVERQGLYARVLWQIVGKTPGYELATLVGEITKLLNTNLYQAVFIDMTGVGFGVVSDLRTLKYNPIGVQFGSSASDDKQYKNKRAECWGLMKVWLAEGGSIDSAEYADRIRDDLTGPDYQYDMQGRLQLEQKETMRKRGLASPDFVDALALTFAMPVAPASAAISRNELDITFENYDYNPLTREVTMRR